MDTPDSTEFGSSDAASLGGKARAAKLSKERKSEIATAGAMARHGKDLPKATHEGTLEIGEMEIPCAVLEGGRRVLSLSGFMIALGRARQAKGRAYYKSDVDLPVFLSANNLKDFIPQDLGATSKGIEFKPLTGGKAYGYSADLLPKVCWVFIDAKNAGKLRATQSHIADKAMVIVRALTSTSIIALVDEATGYQYDRPRKELEEYLKQYLAEELTRWASAFPNDYFKHLCRLKNVQLRPDMRLPQFFGHLTNDLIYKRIAPGLLKALKKRKEERGRASNKLYWWTSEDKGYPELLIHMGTVVGLMKVNQDYDEFHKQLDVVAPVKPDVPGLFDDATEWE